MLPLKDEPPTGRMKVLAAVMRRGPQFTVVRAAAMTASVLILLAVPLTGLARVDVWGGAHRLLGREATLVQGLQGIAVALVVLYGVTFLSNVFVGRFFCGFGCPVGHVSRLGETVELAKASRARRILAHASGAAFVATFVAAVMCWWVDPRVMIDGSLRAKLWTGGVFAALWAGGFLHAFVWRFGFCLSACPIGLYYRFVTSRAPVGIVFSETPSPCTDCGACSKVCPVRLDPRKLDSDQPGLDDPKDVRYGDAECLRCGDCVAACRMVFLTKPGATPPLRFGRNEGGRDATDITSR
ncbi:MAG: hypothetical protein HMLKMBBP_00393 [Planctomycetes bacterium]|nr:hypothetical protein [Planctomycetota bacterium]